MSDKCEWYRSPEDDEYQSACGSCFMFTDGVLSEQCGFRFCPYCGLEIIPKEPAECPICSWEMDADEGCTRIHKAKS